MPTYIFMNPVQAPSSRSNVPSWNATIMRSKALRSISNAPLRSNASPSDNDSAMTFLSNGTSLSLNKIKQVESWASSAVLRPGTQPRPQVAQSGSCSITPQQHEACSQLTLHIGSDTSCRTSCTIHDLIVDKSTRTHECVQHSPTQYSSVLAWRNAGLYLGTVYGPTQRPVPSGIKQAMAPLWNKEHGCRM